VAENTERGDSAGPADGPVTRRSGLGRGLAALLPSGGAEPHPYEGHLQPVQEATGTPAPAPGGGFGPDLVAELAVNPSGLALVYRALDELVSTFALADAAIVIDEETAGRQVFRADRRPLGDDDGTELLFAPPGLYTDPSLPESSLDVALFTSVCTLALRLDLLRYDSWHDPLTGLFDRRSFDRLLDMAVARSIRYQWPFTLVMIDLDDFKELNDREGHLAGDAALRSLGERFRRVLRFGDSAARIGGDEFALMLPNTDPADVPHLLERISLVADVEVPCPSFSYGVAVCPNEAGTTEDLIDLADERLYAAKGGRE